MKQVAKKLSLLSGIGLAGILTMGLNAKPGVSHAAPGKQGSSVRAVPVNPNRAVTSKTGQVNPNRAVTSKTGQVNPDRAVTSKTKSVRSQSMCSVDSSCNAQPGRGSAVGATPEPNFAPGEPSSIDQVRRGSSPNGAPRKHKPRKTSKPPTEPYGLD